MWIFIYMDIRKIIKEEVSKVLSGVLKDNINDNFWNWFGSSKVKSGSNPLVVYHGTRSNFDVFKPSKSIGNQGESDQIEGMYFSDNRDGASFFSLTDDDRYLKSVFLSLKNPYIVTDNNTLKKELEIEILADVNEILKSMGYDGLIMEKGFYAKGGPFRLFLAFYPNQIKSIENDGTWDVGDNNIYS